MPADRIDTRLQSSCNTDQKDGRWKLERIIVHCTFQEGASALKQLHRFGWTVISSWQATLWHNTNSFRPDAITHRAIWLQGHHVLEARSMAR